MDEVFFLLFVFIDEMLFPPLVSVPQEFSRTPFLGVFV